MNPRSGGNSLTESIAHFTRALEALQCGAALVDREGRLVFVNSRLAGMFARPVGELSGRSLDDLYPTESARRLIAASLQRFDAPAEFEFHVPRPDGSVLPVALAASPLTDHGEGPATLRVVTVIDISEQKRMLAQVTDLSDTILEQALDLRGYNRDLEHRVAQRTAELHDANMDAILMLAVASESRDADTGLHVRRIQHLSRALAEAMGLARAEADRIGYSAILHDVGKITVPDAILKKPGRLTADELAVMRRHTLDGEAMLSRRPFFAMARQIARSHHENHDGTGYPDGLGGDAIPLAARIVHVADVFDALTMRRVYKPAWPADRAAEEVRRGRGSLFDPHVIDAFDRLCADDDPMRSINAAPGDDQPR